MGGTHVKTNMCIIPKCIHDWNRAAEPKGDEGTLKGLGLVLTNSGENKTPHRKEPQQIKYERPEILLYINK